MTAKAMRDVEFDDDADEQDVAEQLASGSSAAVVFGTDWTTETVVRQLSRQNIHLNPRFQRRDAWKADRKSRFIESLIVGLPIPQLVLAESKTDRGRFIVLDGKQRLLTLMQFWGIGEADQIGFPLSGLTLRKDLNKRTLADLEADPRTGDFDALSNQPIRTVVLKNWKDTNFLHTVFLRLNTGSVNLSPQELRQALLPGSFSDYVDDAASESQELQELLGLAGPDPRMRDIEILARFLAFRFFAAHYPGRMKQFLDRTFETFNQRWQSFEPSVEAAIKDFNTGVRSLIHIFGDDVARKPDSPQFNRAIFDALIYFQSRRSVRDGVRDKHIELRKAYKNLFAAQGAFAKAIESDTAGSPNTASRMKLWGRALAKVAGTAVQVPQIPLVAKKGSGAFPL